MAQPPPEESNPPPTHSAPLQLNREDLETRAAELLTETQDRQHRHQQIGQTIEMIMNLTHGVPPPYFAMVHQAAAPTVNQQQAELRAVEADLVTLMMKMREIAEKLREYEEAAKARSGTATNGEESEEESGEVVDATRRFEGVSVNDPGTASNEDGPGRVEGKGRGREIEEEPKADPGVASSANELEEVEEQRKQKKAEEAEEKE